MVLGAAHSDATTAVKLLQNLTNGALDMLKGLKLSISSTKSGLVVFLEEDK